MTMTNRSRRTAYTIRDIDPVLWKRFRRAATHDGITMRSAIFLLVDGYARGDIRLSASDVPQAPVTTDDIQQETVTNG